MALFSFRRAAPKPKPVANLPRVPDDTCVYAIGDVHGRIDLFERLIRAVADDFATRASTVAQIVLLGDLVDRGPDSRAVIEFCLAWPVALPRPSAIAGNHEELMMSVLDGDTAKVPFWSRVGGRETMLSYGVAPDVLEAGSAEQQMIALAAAVPQTHLTFLRGMIDHLAIGDYWFVHAGIRPGVPLARQKPKDLRWIRGEFLDHAEHHGGIVVHGHTITLEVDEQPNRIGIDTGAYDTGRLTALAMEGDQRWVLQT